MPPDERKAWTDIARVLGGAFVIYVLCSIAVFFSDPYGRSGFRTALQIPLTSQPFWKVTRAMNPAVDSAIVGNSTVIPIQPETMHRLTGKNFVSLSIAGSGIPVALAVARFFLRYHPSADTLIMGLDDSWCRTAIEGRPFPFWLYGDNLAYAIGLFRNASIDVLKDGLWLEGRNGFPMDGYEPYGEVFLKHGFNDIEVVLKRLNAVSRPVGSQVPYPYAFEPPKLLRQLIDETAQSITFVLFWTPRYLTLIPMPNTDADAADIACKKQVADIAVTHPNVRVINWSGARPENMDPANFYESNHYRDTIGVKIEDDLAAALRD